MWLGRSLPHIPSGATPPSLESYSTFFVQVGDHGLIVPLAALTGGFLVPLGAGLIAALAGLVI
jgi:hypothetical protein